VSPREYDQPCSLACALDRIGERWSLLIVRELSLGPLRFSDLVRNVGGAPTDVLTRRLRDLESHGVVRRRSLDPPATGVVYELTDVGWALERPMLELGRWGLHFERVDDVFHLAPTSLPNAIRVIAQPPQDARLTIGLRSGGRDYWLRVEEGWMAAGRGEADDPDLTLAGEPADVLALIVTGEGAEGGVDIGGDLGALEKLRAMVVLPDRLRQTARALAAAKAGEPMMSAKGL
jgi:DNA-binding HxlR family transcriptional regulator